MKKIFLSSILVFLSFAPLSNSMAQNVKTYDIVVYGGTSAGVTAAVEAARMGKSVVLISPKRHLGGLTSSGLGWTDMGNPKTIGGIAREFYRRVHNYYKIKKHGKSKVEVSTCRKYLIRITELRME